MNKIPNKPRYKYVIEKVYEFIIINSISYYPIDIINIIKQNKWNITKYSEIQNKFNCTNDTVCKNFQSRDGNTYLYIENKKYSYSIIYNDDLTINTDERIRFTLAHEIGHIYLNHLKDFQETEIQRNGLNNKLYGILEKEADMFARNLLCPYPLLKKVVNNFNIDPINIQIINETFKISRQASSIRLNLIKFDKKYPYNKMIETIKVSGYKYCEICYNFGLSHSSICHVCGNHWEYTLLDYINFMKVGNNIMKYSNYEYTSCNNCENEHIIENSNFCHICGTDLRNLCTNTSCENSTNSLPYNARYCNICGEPSMFFIDEKLDNWKLELSHCNLREDCKETKFKIDDSDLPF